MVSFIAEFVIIALHTPPFFDFKYWKKSSGAVKPFVSDKLNVFVFLRLYLFVRVVRDYTAVYSRRRLIYDSGYKEEGGYEVGSLTAMKSVYLQYTTTMIAVLAGGSILILAYMAHVAERDWQPEQFDYKNCVWYVIFFIAAMDYGSMGPKSAFGKGVAVLILVWGMILLSMFVSVVFDCAGLSSYEVWAIDWLKQGELMEQERHVAADVIATWWRYKMAARNRMGKQSNGRKNDPMSETYFKLSTVKKYKLLMEIQFKIRRAGGGDDGFPKPSLVSESAVSLSDSAREIRQYIESQQDSNPDGQQLQSRLAAIDRAHEAILAKLEAMSSSQQTA